MLLFGYGRSAQAQVVPGDPQCVVSGTTVTCTGNLQPGVAVTAPYTILNVNNVTKNIVPAVTVDGIYFGSDYGVTVNSNTGPFSITTAGDDAHGIEAYSYYGAVKVVHKGDIHTRGNDADGVFAYSYYGTVTINQTGNITTRGDDAHGVHADAYGAAKITQQGNITTRGAYAYGILAHSEIGTATVNQTGKIETHGYSAYGILAAAFYGTAVTQTGTITTRGDFADGIHAKSGSGPIRITQTGHVSTQGFAAFGISATSITGAVTVNQTGNISTRGDFSYGIFAYSVFGPISVRHTGNITTRGVNADGLYAYSYAGSKITITQKGDITVTGPHADAIDVDNPDGAGSSLVIIKAGSTITGGTGGGDGIDFQGGTTNRLKNFGTITTRGENAIEGEGSGAEIVDNYGTVTGNVHLGPGANRFNNKSGGLFNSGATAFLGAGNLLHNAGTLSPGGAGKIRTTALTGNMVQTSGGTFAVDLDLGAATTDRVNATGTAKLAGTVAVTPKNPALLTQEFVILSADGGVTNNGLALGPVSRRCRPSFYSRTPMTWCSASMSISRRTDSTGTRPRSAPISIPSSAQAAARWAPCSAGCSTSSRSMPIATRSISCRRRSMPIPRSPRSTGASISPTIS